MKTKKLLRRMKALLSADQRAQLAKYDSLEKVLKKLKTKEEDLREKLDGEKHKEQRRDLIHKLEVIEAQRKKGMKRKKEIEKLRDGQ